MRTINFLNILFVTFLFMTCKIQSQKNEMTEEEEIFKTIIYDRVIKGELNFYISCDKILIPFSKENFLKQTGLKNISENVLNEIENYSKNKNEEKKWSNDFIPKLGLVNQIKSVKCLTKKNKEKLFNQVNNRQAIFSVYKPVFDNKKEHCVVHFTYMAYPGSVFGNSYFLKKIYGKWVIVEEYDHWLS